MESNKADALECIRVAETAVRNGDIVKAERFLRKSIRLYPTSKAQEFLDKLLTGAFSNGSAQKDKTSTPSQEKVPTSKSTAEFTDFTKEQAEAVKRILAREDYYEILGVSKQADDAEIKKAYRKLALQFHPDKNKAPGASEAFKAVGTAFSTLSNPEKRVEYDHVGPRRMNGSASCCNNDFDMSAYETFRQFFDESLSGHIHVRRGGRLFTHTVYPNNNSTNRFRYSFETGEAREASGYNVFMQLMPLIIIGISLFSSFLVPDPLYSLQQSNKYNTKRVTSNMAVNYFVKENFHAEFSGSIRQLETSVEEDFIHSLRSTCYREKNYKESLLWQARHSGNSALLSKAHGYSTPSCERLEKIYGY